MSVVLLTGATGFLGRQIAAECAEHGVRIRCTGRSPQPSVKLPDYRAADLAAAGQIAPLLPGVSCIIHSAGLAHQFGSAAKDQDAFTRGNVVATENVMRAAVAAGIGHVVLVSSVSIYGSSPAVDGQSVKPGSPAGPYGESKLEAERRAISIAERSNTKLTILRMATIYGEGDPGNVKRLISAIDSGRFLWIGRGKNRKSLIHLDDAARACVHAAFRTPRDSAVQIYDVAGPTYRMREVVAAIYRALGKRESKLFLPAWLTWGGSWVGAKLAMGGGFPGRVHQSIHKWLKDDAYDGSDFSRDFDFKPSVSLDEGLTRETEWYRREAA